MAIRFLKNSFRVAGLLLLGTAPLFAQKVPLAPIQRAAGQQAIQQNITRLSRRANRRLQSQLAVLFEPMRALYISPYHTPQEAIAPFAFQVYRGDGSNGTASAFAIEINGRIFGVTAGHVMRNITQMESRRLSDELAQRGVTTSPSFSTPYMFFQKQDGISITAPITSWRLSNYLGSDVAVFEIPAKAQDHIHPLKPAPKRAKPWQVASIMGFAQGKPLWFLTEEVLFASSHRLLLRKTSPILIDGMCGSPVLVNGKVVGLYVGAKEENQFITWDSFLHSNNIPALHYVAPIESIFPLINDLTGTTTLPVPMMKLFGRPGAELRPQDQLYSLALIRNGQQISILHPMELADPEHLENFFELEENDILRITITPHTYTAQKDKIFEYDVNVSSGQVTRREMP